MKTAVHGGGVIISIALNAAKRMVKTQRLRLQVQRSAFTKFKAKRSTERGKFVDNKRKKRKTVDETPVIITIGIASSKKGILNSFEESPNL